MNNDLVSVEITVADEEKLLRALFKHGVKMPVQCNEGFCGTCVCKSNPSQFNEVHDQLGLLDSEDNVLPCAVRAKEGVNKSLSNSLHIWYLNIYLDCPMTGIQI